MTALTAKQIMPALTRGLSDGRLAAFRDAPSLETMNAILDSAAKNLRALFKSGKAKPAADDVKVAAKKKVAAKSTKTADKPARKAKVAAKVEKPATKKTTTAKAKAKPAAAKASSGDFAPGDRVRCDGDKGTIRRLRGAQAYVDFDDETTDKVPLSSLTKIAKKAK